MGVEAELAGYEAVVMSSKTDVRGGAPFCDHENIRATAVRESIKGRRFTLFSWSYTLLTWFNQLFTWSYALFTWLHIFIHKPGPPPICNSCTHLQPQ